MSIGLSRRNKTFQNYTSWTRLEGIDQKVEIMKKFLKLLVFVSNAAFSQDLDTLSVDTLAMDTAGLDSVEKVAPYYAAAYLMGEVRIAPHFEGTNIATGLGIGIQYNRFQLGFEVYNFQGTIETLVIFPNVFSLDYKYAGPTVGFEVYDHKWFSVDLMASYRRGDMIWKEIESDTDFFRDEFDILSFKVSIDLDRFRYAKPYFTVGYQKTNNLILERVDNQEFTGIFFAIGMRIGYFNQ